MWGANGGYLGLALARVTDLAFTFLDISAEALETAVRNIAAGVPFRSGKIRPRA